MPCTFSPLLFWLYAIAPRIGVRIMPGPRSAQRCSEGAGGDDGHRTVSRGDAVHFFSVALLAVRHRAQNRGQDHAGAVDPGQGFVQLDWAFGFGACDSWSANGVVGGNAIQVAGNRDLYGI